MFSIIFRFCIKRSPNVSYTKVRKKGKIKTSDKKKKGEGFYESTNISSRYAKGDIICFTL